MRMRAVTRKLKTFVELPVPVASANDEVLKRLRRFNRETIHGVVFSDKAGGLEQFCEAEDIISRDLVAEAKRTLSETGNGMEVWNVLRTGDRCVPKVQNIVDTLEAQGSTGFLFVSGHDYRTTLLRRASRGELCTKNCIFREQEESVLCGKLSSILMQEKCIRLKEPAKAGLVLTTGYGEDVPDVDFHITQACPPLITEAWLMNLQLGRIPPTAELFITVIPTLSVNGLERIKSLGTDLPLERLRKELAVDNPKQRGIELAKEAMQICAGRAHISGFYLYSYDTTALVELASFVRSL